MINWKYIKGLNQTNNNDILYSFITFATNGNNSVKRPSVYWNTSNQLDTNNNLGYIITSGDTNQSITTAFTFVQQLYVNNGIYSINANPAIYLQNAITSPSTCSIIKATTTQLEFYVTNTVTPKATLSNAGALTVADLWATNIAHAVYFDATSDKRAKTKLKAVDINALDIIKNIPVYSFEYTYMKLPSIGIIAQDIQNVDIAGFKFVENENASGKDLDFMSIHESKLIYILWKAVQEQQAEIEELKKRLK